MSKIAILSLVGFLLLQSCSFKEKVTFNADFSGDVACELDLSQMAALNEESGESMMDSSMVANMENLKGIEGISKVSYKEVAKGIIELSYHFKNIEALNKSCQTMNNSENGVAFEYFKLLDKKTLIIDLPSMVEPETEEKQEEGELGMSEMFTYDLTVVLPKKIKSIFTKGEAVIQSEKEVFLKSDLGKMTKKDFNSRIEVKF